uniref:Uncharacterized protein n=1 Tax=Arion vulgaris TaxID=1028688 RepID=A0A0B7B1M7_9EUPU
MVKAKTAENTATAPTPVTYMVLRPKRVKRKAALRLLSRNMAPVPEEAYLALRCVTPTSLNKDPENRRIPFIPLQF